MEQPYFPISDAHAIIAASCVVAVYILGLLLKMIYYKFFHPNIAKEELKEDDRSQLKVGLGPMRRSALIEDVECHVLPQPDEDLTDAPYLKGFDFIEVTNRTGYSEPAGKRCNKRMRKLAENFYS